MPQMPVPLAGEMGGEGVIGWEIADFRLNKPPDGVTRVVRSRGEVNQGTRSSEKALVNGLFAIHFRCEDDALLACLSHRETGCRIIGLEFESLTSSVAYMAILSELSSEIAGLDWSDPPSSLDSVRAEVREALTGARDKARRVEAFRP